MRLSLCFGLLVYALRPIVLGNETCDSTNPPSLLKTECEFPIIWYFRDSDTYNFLVVITNEVSSHIEVIPVTVYDVASQSPISIVIIPVISSILVVVIIITGVALSAHYRYNIIQCSTLPNISQHYSKLLNSTQQYSAVLSSTQQYSAVLSSTQQYSAVLNSTALNDSTLPKINQFDSTLY